MRRLKCSGIALGLALLLISGCSAPLPEESEEATAAAKVQAPKAPAYRWGDPITFGKTGNSKPYQTSGFSLPETGYTWAVGDRAVISLPLEKPAPDGVQINFRAWPLWRPGGGKTRQTVEVQANGEDAGVWTLDRQGMQEHVFRVPKDATAGGGVLTLVFHFPDATTPKAMGINRDERVLSVAFVELKLQP